MSRLSRQRQSKLMKRHMNKGAPAPSGPPRPAPVSKKMLWLSVALIVCVGAAAYANAPRGAFILDDDMLVGGNVYIRDWKNVPKIFSEDVGEGGGGDYNFWRPLQLLTYMVDYSFWKANPFGYHLTNILLHVLAALALFWLIQVLWGDHLLALLTSLLFVAHPVHTEAVTYISGRPDPLATVFILLTLVFVVKAADSRKASLFWLAALSYVAALLSRENSLIVPVLLVFIGSAFRKRLPALHVGMTALLAGAYIVLRFTVFEFLFVGHAAPTTLAQRFPGFFVALASYIRILVFPVGLHMEYGTKTFPFAHPQVFLGLVMFSALVFLLLREKKKRSLVYFSLSWFLITLLPVANLYPLNAYMAEHWLYLPSIGFFLVVARWFSVGLRNSRARLACLAGIAALLAFYAVLTVRQNATWFEPLSFYQRTLRYAPDSSRAYGNLGMIYSHNGDNEKALELYNKAIELDPKNFKAHYNLGILYADLGKDKEAEESYKTSLSIKPTYVNALNNLAMVYTKMGRQDEALALTSRAVGLKDTHVQAYNNMAIAYIRLGKNREGIEASQKVLAIEPANEKALNNMGAAYLNLEEYDKALAAYKKLIEVAPEYPEARHNMGLVYRAMGRIPEAIACFEKAIELRPKYARAYFNLGAALEAAGQADAAQAAYEKAKALDPGYAPVREILEEKAQANKDKPV